VCSRCIMDDEGDSTISFKSDGTCNYCNDAKRALETGYFPDETGQRKLEETFSRIKSEGKGKDYDCMMGLSGGLDSAYAAYLGWKSGLRILMVHVDDGMDAAVTTENIKKITGAFNFDLIIEKPDKEAFAELTRAFVMAGLPDIAIPQDNVLLATLYKFAVRNNIKYLLSGENYSLESITQRGQDASDRVHILDINKKFGRMKYDGRLPLFSILEKQFKYKYLHKIQFIKPLHYVDYNAERALKELSDAFGYEYYGKKHWESRFTKFLQAYYLPTKFNIDKRKSHLSSMIISGQLSRQEALALLQEPHYDKADMEVEIGFILGYLDISRAEFDRVMAEPPRKHSEFRSSVINRMALFMFAGRKILFGY
jgi:N-acetyl sugar amidotransferase